MSKLINVLELEIITNGGQVTDIELFYSQNIIKIKLVIQIC